jgi:proline dehydrogenase
MLRSFLIYLSKAAWAQKLVTNWGIAWSVASRFVAGVTAGEAIGVIRGLNEACINATLDQLGENTSTVEEADRATSHIIQVLDEIEKAGVRANVSIKLTQIGMALDEEICRQNLVRLLEQAKKYGTFVRIDMEDTPYTDTTLAMYYSMLQRGFNVTQVGIVVQAYLYRTEADVRKLLQYRAHLRLVKGAYKEPSDKAFPKKADVDANFDLLTKIMIDAACKIEANKISADGRVPPVPAIATHDEKRIAFAKQYAEKVGLPKDAIEFQMLYGIRRDLQEQLVKQGYPVRVYVPFGKHWYPYFMRRLAERPANIWFFISNFLRK